MPATPPRKPTRDKYPKAHVLNQREAEAYAEPKKLGISLSIELQTKYEHAVSDYVTFKRLTDPSGSALAEREINRWRRDVEKEQLGDIKKGGPHRDIALRSLIFKIYMIYLEATGKEPKVFHKSNSEDLEGYEETYFGEFLDLVYNSLSALGYPPQSKNALGKFMQRSLKELR